MISGIISLLFVILIIGLGSIYGQTTEDFVSGKYHNISGTNQSIIDVSKNPNFTFFNATSGLPTYWSDSLKSCIKYFSCTIKFTEGWNDYVSFGISTANSTQNTWSSIKSTEYAVKPSQRIQLVSHMKLNNWAIESHVALEGFNETSKGWYQIVQCPNGSDGPMEWREFNCSSIIPKDTSSIRVILNAGWSSVSNKEATTWFDTINLLTNK